MSKADGLREIRIVRLDREDDYGTMRSRISDAVIITSCHTRNILERDLVTCQQLGRSQHNRLTVLAHR
jgi:hypothetical protein